MPPEQSKSAAEIRPMWRPFVWRPFFYASILPGLILAACFFFWTFIYGAIGQYTWLVVGLCVAIPAFILVERLVRFGKTRYELRPGKIVVQTGSFFREHSVELDVGNITLVEWQSPFFLRKFYGVGHVAAQEAGSADKPAQMNYVEHPEQLYRQIGDAMRERGFKMSRQRQIQRETPGHLGATVDLLAAQFAVVWAIILAAPQLAIEALPLLIGENGSLEQLVLGEYAPFAETMSQGVFLKARIGFVLLGTIVVVGVVGWLVVRYLDLYYREYTLYDDVIDYVDGFLNETRKYIPLEALADTEVSHPLFKRIFGLSDVTLSSKGAENAIKFRSTPNGASFSESIEKFVDQSPTAAERRAEQAREAQPQEGSPDESEDVASTNAHHERIASDTYEGESLDRLSPTPFRAALRGSWMLPGTFAFILFLSVPTMIESGKMKTEVAGYVMTGFITVMIGSIVIGTFVAIATGFWWMIKAWAMEFSFDQQGAKYSYDLFSREDRRFAPERITSVSIHRNPLDWLAGTMTVQFRSIGSDENIKFWGIPHSFQTLDIIRGRLGLARQPIDDRTAELTPEYGFIDGVKADAPLYAIIGILPAVAIGVVAWFEFPTGGVVPAVAVSLMVGFVLAHQLWLAIKHSRIDGGLRDGYADVTGGVFREYQHLTPFEHIKAVESLRYPGSDHGKLTFKTAGFPLRVGHLPAVKPLHESVDTMLDGESGAIGQVKTRVQPGAGTQAIRSSWTLLFGVGLLIIPYTYAYYRLAEYAIEDRRLVSDEGLYFDVRTTVLFSKVDHIESNRIFAHHLSDSHDIQVYTVGSKTHDLTFLSVPRDQGILEMIRAG